jgi:iron complex outermembrane receptor protein
MNGFSRLRGVLTLGVSATALLVAAPVLAQTTNAAAPPAVTVPPAAATAPGPAAANGVGIPEVVVTAEKRSANIQHVPVAVTAFTAKDRALKGINSVQDITNFTPGLTYSSQLDRPVMRGLARSNNIYSADSSVGVYDNDLFTNSTFLVGRDDMIVDQVEVLLGPQNTLYGRNAIGGVINTQSKRPSDIFGGEIREEYGNYRTNKIEGTVTGPLSFINDNLTFRLSGYYDAQDQGYFKNLSGKDVGGIRHDPYVELQLQYKGERDDVWLMMYNLTFNGDRSGPGALQGTPSTGPYDTSLVDTNNTLFFNPNFAYSGGAVPGSVVGAIPGGNPTTVRNRIVALSENTNISVDDAYSFNFHWTHHFDGFDVKYVTGYTQYHYTSSLNDDVTGDSSIQSYQLPTFSLAQVPVTSGNVCGFINASGGACAPLTVDGNQGFSYNSQVKWYSQELDFSSNTSGKLSWIGGLYYYNETDNNPETESASTQPQLNASGFNVIPVSESTTLIPTILGGGTPTKSIFNPSQAGDFSFLDYQDRIQTTAVFGQVSYKLTDTIKLTGGIRYSYDYKNAQEEARFIALSNGTLASLLGQNTPALDVTEALVSFAPGKGIASPVTLPTTGKYAGDAVRKLADSSSAVTGTAAIEWTPDRDTLAYARYNRGYKALALNAGYVGANPEAAPESVNDYEIGLKKTFNRTLQIDIAAFYYDYANDQLPLAFPTSTPIGSVDLNQFVNIPKAVSDGVEVTAVWNPIRHLNLSLTYGYDHTEIMTGCNSFTTPLGTATNGCFIDPADPFAQAKGAKPAGPSTSTTTVGATTLNEVFQSVKGNSLPQAPANKIAFNANYTMYFEPGNLTLSGSYIWKDHSYSSIFTRTQYDYAPSWSQVDLRATWSGNHDKYEVVFFVKNLFDTIGYDAAANGLFNAQPQGGGASTYSPVYDITPPRLYGAELHYKF